jgi:hypothetical protein
MEIYERGTCFDTEATRFDHQPTENFTKAGSILLMPNPPKFTMFLDEKWLIIFLSA